jgi:anti-sigma factor RsiW
MTTKSSKPSQGSPPPAPTDLELMLYADGELDGERLAEVEAHVTGDRTARRKLLGLGMAAVMVRERALQASPIADGLADSIMAAIEAEPAPSAAAEKPAEKSADVVALPRRSRPSNDNARGYLLLAVAAMAAAAGLLFWGRTAAPPTGGVVAGRDVPTALTVQAPPEPEGDVRHGVEVASVDFGAHTGAVFYVPSGLTASSTTTVVWLSDDPSGGDE